MSTDRLNKNFQKFLQTIYHWPTISIEKSVLIDKLEELCRQNPELQHVYENIPLVITDSPPIDPNLLNKSGLELTETSSIPSTVSNDSKSLQNSTQQLTVSDNSSIRKESNPLPTMTIVKGGELTVKKGSTVLSPLLKKNKIKAPVYGELAHGLIDNEKVAFFTIYHSEKCRKLLHRFAIDDTCAFLYFSKREFQFRHHEVLETFILTTGTADTWISSFREISIILVDEDIYENPDDFSSDSEGSLTEYTVVEPPARPPPRPFRPIDSLSPEKIYVCLYTYSSSTNDSNELEFNCGDLLYILNTDGPNYYVGYRLILPLNNNQGLTSKGLVFKDYIKPAYEKL